MPTPTVPWSALPDTKPKHPSTGFAASRGGLPARSRIRTAIPRAARPVPQTSAALVSMMLVRPRHPPLKMVPLHAQLRRGTAHTFPPRNLCSRRPELVRYRGFPFAVASPFFEARLHFFQADGRFFAARHGLPPRQNRRKKDLISYARRTSCILAGNSRFIEDEQRLLVVRIST